MYDSSIEDSVSISMDDKKALCTGIARVLAVLHPEQWSHSLLSLTSPTIEYIESLEKVVNNNSGEVTEKLPQIIERIGEEICVLAIAIRSFNVATSRTTGENSIDSPAFSVLDRVWPCLNLIASTLCNHPIISASLSELLLVAVSLSEKTQNVLLLTKLYEISITMIDCVCKSDQIRSLDPIMDLVSGIISTFGPIADAVTKLTGSELVSNETHKIRDIVEQLTRHSFAVVNTVRSDVQIDMLPAMFTICTSGIQRCPILFMALNTQTDGSQVGQIFSSSITVAISSIDEKHIDVARTAMLYLKEVVSRIDLCLSLKSFTFINTLTFKSIPIIAHFKHSYE